MQNVVKWPKYVWPFYSIMHERGKSLIWWKIVFLSNNYAILRAKAHFMTTWNMLSTQNEMIFFNIPFALDQSLLQPSVYFWVINITIWPLLFDELTVDIRPSISHTTFGPSHITLFFQPPARSNLCYQRKFLLSKCLFLRRTRHSMVSFLW